MTMLRRMQRVIERLHGAPSGLDVRAYVVDDAVRAEIPGARIDIPEQLFVRESDEGLELALYIEPRLVSQLERDNPFARLHPGNLEPYAVALEGVSHFVLVAWRAARGRPVSLLELEIQAEIDKFVVSWLLLARQGQPLLATATPLIDRLFANYALHDALDDEESDRYDTANRVARRYCTHLARCYKRHRDFSRVRRSLRGFYRKGLADKLRAA